MRARLIGCGGRRGRIIAARALELLRQVGMNEAADRPCRELAYGDVKRVELAIALASEPRLLLMDEPTAGMAPRERNELIALVKKLVVERGVSVLFTEHSMDVVFAFADRIVVMARGRLIADGDAKTIRDDPLVREVYFGSGTNVRAREGSFMNASPALAVEHLNAWYGAAQVLYDMSFTIGRGEVVALMGRNGAGKSTTMKAVMGLMARRSGMVRINGRDVSALKPFEIARLGVGFMPEDRRIFSDLTVQENLDTGRQPPRHFADGAPAPAWTSEASSALSQSRRASPASGRTHERRRATNADDRAHAHGQSTRRVVGRAVGGHRPAHCGADRRHDHRTEEARPLDPVCPSRMSVSRRSFRIAPTCWRRARSAGRGP